MNQRRAKWVARYMAWSVPRWRQYLVGGALLFLVAVYLVAFKLPIRADLSYLLPADAPSVVALRHIESRVVQQEGAYIVVRAANPEARAQATKEVLALVGEVDPSLIAGLYADDVELREFVAAHAPLYASLADLTEIRDLLREKVDGAKLAANPLFIDLAADLDEGGEATAADLEARIAAMRDKQKQAAASLKKSSFISADGKIGHVAVMPSFGKTDTPRGKRLAKALQTICAKVEAKVDGAELGITGGLINSVLEQAVLLRGMMMSGVITGVLVAICLIWFLRSLRLFLILSAVLVWGVVLSQGAAALTVGYLNAATAFLGTIIAGNGVNFGVVLLGRFVDEARRGGVDVRTAMESAVTLTIGPTMIASLGASIAYGSLAATSFRGFADFAIIGAVGMLICWLATYLVLPPLVVRFAKLPKQTPNEPALARALARFSSLLSPRAVAVVVGLLFVGGAVISWNYVANDPFEYRMQKMRGVGKETLEAREWMRVIETSLQRNFTGQTFIAAASPDQVMPLVNALGEVDKGKPQEARLLGPVTSIYSVLPYGQAAKLALLSEIRTILSPSVLESLPAPERAELEDLLPRADLRELTANDLPASIQARLREKDGRMGLLLTVQPFRDIGDWDGRQLLSYANTIRKVELADGTSVMASSAAVIFADILSTIRRDGPRVTLLALCLVAVMLLAVVGLNRRAFAVLLSTVLGTMLLIAISALAGFRITFLDFVVLPMTLGLGIDYGINMATQRDEAQPDDALVSTAGAAVFVCSLTTIIGYGSLLVSENLAIRGFGVMSLLGELCCLLVSLLIVPAVMRSYARLPSTQR